ncbi:putative protein FAR1-RELATED SEQUENCE 10 [Bienertia sinuspersici]
MEEGVGDGEGSNNNQMKAKDGEDEVQENAMECAEGVGRDDAVDDVIVGNECDEVYDVGSYAATGAGLEELDVEQCVGESNIEIRRGSVSVFNIDDNATQRGVSDTTNVDGVVTPTVGSVYNSLEEVERMFKAYEEKKGFGVIRGQSVYYGGTENKRAMTMRCECYGCPDMKIKNDEKKRKKHMEIGGCSGEELMFRRRRKSQKCSCPVRYRMEHFTTSMRSHVFNDIDAGVPLANIHDAKFRAFQRKYERLMYCYVKEEIPNGDHMYSYVIEDRAWKTGKGGIHEYLTPKRRMYNCVHNIEQKEIQCRCKMFETHGILCRHVIRVLDMNLYEEPPDKTCDIVSNGLKRISDEVRAYNVAHAEEQAHAACPPTDNGSADVTGQLEASQRSVVHDIIPELGSAQCAATTLCGDPPVPKKKGKPKGSRYKSPGEKGWKKANQSASQKGVSGGKRNSQADIAQMMASSFMKMKVTKNTNVSYNMSTPYVEENMQHPVIQYGVEEDNLLSRNCISWE